MRLVLSEADVRYIAANYLTLDQVCAGRFETPDDVRGYIEAGKLPRPSYTLDDGTEMVPRDYFAIMDAAGGVDRLPAYFQIVYTAAAELQGGLREGEAEREWDAYLTGAYGICLRQVSPETIVRKDRLVSGIEHLLEQPRPDDELWRSALRSAVDELDGLEREFAEVDRQRTDGPVSRDRLITAVREQFPAVFAAAVAPA
jgi:hypothetical protein